MPLPKRAIFPVIVSNISVPKEVDNELEYVANATLSNLTRQLASLSLQAADVFRELTERLTAVFTRSEVLGERIESVKAMLGDTGVREDLLGLGTGAGVCYSVEGTAYRSRMEAEQQVLGRQSMPRCIAEVYYTQCEAPPALEQLDRFRYDGKQSMKFYTDPGFFFQLWCQEMLQGQQDKDSKARRKKKKKRVKKQAVVTTKRSESQNNSKNNADGNKVVQNGGTYPSVDSSSSLNRAKNTSFNGFELPLPLLAPMDSHNVNLPQPQFNYEDVSIYNTIVPPRDLSPMGNRNTNVNENSNDDLGNISPPPPSMSYLSHKPGAHPTASSSNIPPPPPPMNSNQHNNDQSFRNQSIGQENQQLSNVVTIKTQDSAVPPPPAPPAPPPPPSIPPPPSSDTGSKQPPIYAVNAKSIDLLTAIRNGIHLRKVGDDDSRPVPITEAVYKAEKKFDVQAIFEEVYKRRPYVDNNSDSDEGSDEDEDSSLWSSDNDNNNK